MSLPELSLDKRSGLPDALRVLVNDYPRDAWEAHAGFNGLVQFWMQRHMMFRELVQILGEDAQRFASGDTGIETYAPRLRHYAGTLLNELHGHHQIEDQHYFPRLVGLDARLARGFDLLDVDHDAMDGLLHGMAEGANSVLNGGEIGPFLDRLDGFSGLLERHLTDEEDIIVPVILHSGFRG